MWHVTAFGFENIHAQHQSFILPAVHNYAPLGAQHDRARVAGGFQGGCRGSHRAALHLLSSSPVPFPWMSLSISLRKEVSHKGQMAAGAYVAV